MSEIKQLCELCQKERSQFAQDGNPRSPGCAALWRQAFAADERAWECVQSIFAPWVSRLCIAAIDKSPKFAGLSKEDLPDVRQDVWLNLVGYSTRNSEAVLQLVERDDISRVIGLIKTTVKNRVLELCRKPRGNEEPLLEGDESTNEERAIRNQELPHIEPPDSESKLDLLAFIKKHIQTAKEAIVAEVILLQAMKPQDVFDLYPQHFKDVKEINQTLQTLVRRMRNDPARRNLGGSASLHFRLDQDEVRMDFSEPCPYDESILLDYLNGHLDSETRQAIERSPACIAAATALRADVEEWRPSLRQLFCPNSERLVDYQERRLTGTDYLVVHKHVQNCPYCRAELAMLAAVDDVAEKAQPSLARRIYQLLFQPATLAPVPMRGEGSYRTIERSPQIELLVKSTKTSGKQDNWMLLGRLRYEDDQPVTPVEAIRLHDLEDEEAPEVSTTVDEMGRFTLKGLDAGRYRLHILMPQEEIILHEFRIGDE
ncbi:MAG: carboxypeptidase-like regulatory domain-containing protein [Caldilineaceae bacterium]